MMDGRQHVLCGGGKHWLVLPLTQLRAACSTALPLASQARHSRASLLTPPGTRGYLKPFVQRPARPHASRQQWKVISSGSMASRCTMYLHSGSGGRSGSEWEGRVGAQPFGGRAQLMHAMHVPHASVVRQRGWGLKSLPVQLQRCVCIADCATHAQQRVDHHCRTAGKAHTAPRGPGLHKAYREACQP